MFTWTSVEIWTKKIIKQNQWRVPQYEADDLLQEARIVFWRVETRHSDESVLAYAGTTIADPTASRVIARSRMAMYKRALINRFASITARKETRTVRGSVSRDEGQLDWLVGQRDQAREVEALELRLDLERSPRVQAVLERASWDQGGRHQRSPRTRGGVTETTNEVLTRLGGLPWYEPVAAELALMCDFAV